MTDVYRASALMTAGTALSRLTGLVRVAALTYALGIAGTRLADTYNLANTTPNILYELFLGGIFTSVFVPVLVAMRSSRGDHSALVSVSLCALAVISVLAAVAAPLIVKIYTFRIADPEVRRAQEELATFLLRWFSPQIFFYGLSAIAQALLNARQRFGPPAFVPVLNNLTVAATFFAFARVFGEQGLHLSAGARVLLGAGTTAGVIVQGLSLLPFLRGAQLRFRPRLHDEGVRTVLRLAGYAVGYVVVNQMGLWVVLALANSVRGGVTSYQVAFMFFQLPHGLFAVSLVTAILPGLSASATDGDFARYRSSFWTGMRGVAYLLLPAAIGYAILSRPITRLVVAHGAADAGDAAAVASVLQAFTAGLVFFSAFQLLTRSFYALQDTRTPLGVNAFATLLRIVLSVPLFASLGVPGLAWAHAVSYACGSLWLARRLGDRIGGLDTRTMAAPLWRIAAAAAAMGGAVWVIRAVLGAGDLVTVAVCVGAGAILYIAFSQVMGIPERRSRRPDRERPEG